jgi:hypothetical protein
MPSPTNTYIYHGRIIHVAFSSSIALSMFPHPNCLLSSSINLDHENYRWYTDQANATEEEKGAR